MVERVAATGDSHSGNAFWQLPSEATSLHLPIWQIPQSSGRFGPATSFCVGITRVVMANVVITLRVIQLHQAERDDYIGCDRRLRELGKTRLDSMHTLDRKRPPGYPSLTCRVMVLTFFGGLLMRRRYFPFHKTFHRNNL